MALTVNPQAPFTITSLYEFASYANWNLDSFFGLSVVNCDGLEYSYTASNCNQFWSEDSRGGISHQHRNLLRSALLFTETKLSNYLGYWIGPKYICDETHVLTKWNKIIRTDYSKVVQTGTRERTRLFGNGDVPMSREFRSHYHSQAPDTIRYTFGNGVDALNLPQNCQFLAFPEGFDTLDRGTGENDTQIALNEAYMLRPLNVVQQSETLLVIDVPIQVAVKPQLYFMFPNNRDDIKALNLCDESNFIENLVIYAESYTRPDGYITIDKRYCSCCNGSGCDGCELTRLPICLKPLSTDRGKFKIQPIVNTAEEGEPPCWEEKSINKCCEYAGISSQSCYDICNKPIEVCISYVSSCNNCHKPECLQYGACPELMEAIVKMTLANLPVHCKCDCLTSQAEEMRANWALSTRAGTFRIFNNSQFELGTKVGDVEAWLSVQNLPRTKGGLSVGMVG